MSPGSLPRARCPGSGAVMTLACAALLGCEDPRSSDPATEDRIAHRSLVRLDFGEGSGPQRWSFESSWDRADLVTELPGPRPAIRRWEFSSLTNDELAEQGRLVRSIQDFVPTAPPTASAELGIVSTEGGAALRFGEGGFGALVLGVPVSPRTRYCLRAEVRGRAAPEEVFQGLVVCSLREELDRSPDDAELARLWSSPEARSFQDQFLRAEFGEDEAWNEWTVVLPPTMFGTRSLLISVASGFSLVPGATAAAFELRSLELHEVPTRDALGCRDFPPVELPDADAIDALDRRALVRRDQDSRPARLLTRGAVASCRFPARGAARLELAATIVPEARLGRDGPHHEEVQLELHAGGEVQRQVLRLELHEDAPRFWSEHAFAIPADAGDCELRVELPGEDGDDGALVALAVPRLLPRARGDGPLNVLWISLDTLRADRVGSRGEEPSLTPRLDALAARATVYDRAYSTSSYTLPAHVSMLTGQHVDRHRMLDPRRRLSPDTETFTERLAEAGYRTAAFTAGAMLNPEFCGLHRGFDEYTEIDPMVSEIDPLPQKVPRWYAPEYNAAVFAAHRLERRVLPWLRERRDPFFCFLHTYLVHDYHPDRSLHDQLIRPELDAARRPEGAGPPLWQRDAGATGVTATSLTQLNLDDPAQWVRERDLPYLQSLYDATVRQADRELGRVLDTLEEAGLADRTIVVVTSDHGEEFLEHGGLGHARTLYEEVLRIPLIVAVPGQPPRVVDEAVDLADLAPTLLELLELPPLPAATGSSVWESSDLRTLHHGVVLHAGAARQSTPRLLRAAQERNRKLIQTFDGVGALDRRISDAERARLEAMGYVLPEESEGTMIAEELYDLDADPRERQPEDRPDRAAQAQLQRLRGMLEGEVPSEDGP